MPKRLASLLSCFAWLIASAALAQAAAPPTARKSAAPTAAGSSAQEQPPAQIGEVVVVGHAPPTPPAFPKVVEKFVHDLGRPGPVGQVSRWGTPLCPLTEGLTPGFDDFVTRRIRQVAAQVGAPGPGDCREGTNVLVVFTTEPDRLMADVRKRHEQLLGFHYVGETRSLAAFQPPMKSWYVTMTIGPGWRNIDTAYRRLLPNGYGHFPPPMKSEFAFALVVVDSRLLEGQEIGPVADRIAMLALSRPAPRAGCSPLPSVMDLLEPDCPSGASTKGLTAYDEAYLKALYGYKGSEIRAFEREGLRKSMIRDTRPAASGPKD